jgi:hypothetical protein
MRENCLVDLNMNLYYVNTHKIINGCFAEMTRMNNPEFPSDISRLQGFLAKMTQMGIFIFN